jgi:hypothetical protein
LPSRALTNAILVPSGEKKGQLSDAELFVNLVTPVPSPFIV